MNKGHRDAQYYRVDFAKVVIDEMVKEQGGEVSKPETASSDNESTLKEVFG